MDYNLFYYAHRINENIIAINSSIISFYELTLVIDGELNYTVDGKKYKVIKNSAIFIKPNSKRARIGGLMNVNFVSFNFQTNDDLSFDTLLSNIIDPTINNIIKASLEIKPPYDENSKNTLSYLLGAIISHIKATIKKDNYNEVTKKIISYINENYTKKITLDDICNHVNYSSSYIDYVFRKDTNKSIFNYLTDYRIDLAKELLSNQIDLKRIANMIGFDDYNYFSRIFKKKVGVSPLKYKNGLYSKKVITFN